MVETLQVVWTDPRGKEWNLTTGEQGVILDMDLEGLQWPEVSHVFAHGDMVRSASRVKRARHDLKVLVGWNRTGQDYYNLADEWWGQANSPFKAGRLMFTRPDGQTRSRRLVLADTPATSYRFDPGLGQETGPELWPLTGDGAYWDGPDQEVIIGGLSGDSRMNYIINPRFAGSSSYVGWNFDSGLSLAVSGETLRATFGRVVKNNHSIMSVSSEGSIPVKPGDEFIFSMNVWCESASSVTLRVFCYNDASASIWGEPFTISGNGGFKKITCAGVVPAGVTYLRPAVLAQGDLPMGTKLAFRDPMVEVGTTNLRPSFNGSSGAGYQWTGDVDRSPSLWSEMSSTPFYGPNGAGWPLYIAGATVAEDAWVSNRGQGDMWIDWELTGPMTNVQLGLEDGGRITYAGAIPQGQTVLITTAPGRRTVTEVGSGESRYAYVSGVFEPVPVGERVPLYVSAEGMTPLSKIVGYGREQYARPF